MINRLKIVILIGSGLLALLLSSCTQVNSRAEQQTSAADAAFTDIVWPEQGNISATQKYHGNFTTQDTFSVYSSTGILKWAYAIKYGIGDDATQNLWVLDNGAVLEYIDHWGCYPAKCENVKLYLPSGENILLIAEPAKINSDRDIAVFVDEQNILCGYINNQNKLMFRRFTLGGRLEQERDCSQMLTNYERGFVSINNTEMNFDAGYIERSIHTYHLSDDLTIELVSNNGTTDGELRASPAAAGAAQRRALIVDAVE